MSFSVEFIYVRISPLCKVAVIASVEIRLMQRGPDSHWKPEAWKLLRVYVTV